MADAKPPAHLAERQAVRDIVDRIGDGASPVDFLAVHSFAADHIITNPPFNLGVEFALHGLGIVTGKVCILQRTAWLEGERRYQQLFRHQWLANVWQFRRRVSICRRVAVQRRQRVAL